MEGKATFATNATNMRGIRWNKSAGTYIPGSDVRLPSGAGGTLSVVAPPTSVYLVAGEAVEMQVYQNSGGNLATVAGSGQDTTMIVSAVWVTCSPRCRLHDTLVEAWRTTARVPQRYATQWRDGPSSCVDTPSVL
ncbi:hypothetical protein GCM10010124_39650 [Pilimelia terevasa]|uniref:Uncharacterized protein n=1 Tax=Pilimelia terevasa TaxID=53372 RepID=A0A8J3BTV7_9ACTN|nr:hypothetical protein GCM10010124_39650 [Pilimelia terevasa]